MYINIYIYIYMYLHVHTPPVHTVTDKSQRKEKETKGLTQRIVSGTYRGTKNNEWGGVRGLWRWRVDTLPRGTVHPQDSAALRQLNGSFRRTIL